LSSDTNISRVFLGHYQDLFHRIQKVTLLIDLPNLDDIEIELVDTPTNIRKMNRQTVLKNMETWWKDFIDQLKHTSNEYLCRIWQLKQLTKTQWDVLRKQERYTKERVKYTEQQISPNARNYQNFIQNRERFLRRLSQEVEKYFTETIDKIEEESKLKTLEEEIAKRKEKDFSTLDIDIEKIIPEKQLYSPFEEWMINLSSIDRKFIDDLLFRFNKGEGIAIYEIAKKHGVPKQKIEYFKMMITEYLPSIQKIGIYKRKEYYLEVNNENWLLMHGNNVTSVILKYMYNQQRYTLSLENIQEFYNVYNRKWIIKKMKKISKMHFLLDLKIEQQQIEIFKLRKTITSENKHDSKKKKKEIIKKSCSLCFYCHNLDIFKRTKSRGKKWFCLAFNEFHPKEIKNLSNFPKWCPKDSNQNIKIPLCYSCKYVSIQVQIKQKYEIVLSKRCQKSLKIENFYELKKNCQKFEVNKE